ncbi:GNAT family N-acetyltransferase [Psychrobacillus sp. NPDC096426]|uniref:GNAT family N-acetyltransferase n=1 Tax=Psychrobacillus sp. NPDC096426 TaxID=3364491 RepID=UPI003805ACDD
MNIRKATLLDARGIAQVHVDSWITTYRNIVPDEYLNQLTYDAREQLWKKNLGNDNAFVAENENGKIIGFADGGKERTGKYRNLDGELYSIYILSENQSQGIGRLLLKEVVNELKNKGMNSMLIWVLKDNRSYGFYEKMCGKVVDSKSIEIFGKRLIEVAYGWEDIGTIK